MSSVIETKNATKLKITQVRSEIGKQMRQRRTLEALGLKGYKDSVIQNDGPAIRGMIFQVRHLVEVEELEGGKE